MVRAGRLSRWHHGCDPRARQARIDQRAVIHKERCPLPPGKSWQPAVRDFYCRLRETPETVDSGSGAGGGKRLPLFLPLPADWSRCFTGLTPMDRSGD
jgi:hypothetical protein